MRLLFVTQKLKEQDAFGVLWVREFLRQGCEVTVICLEGDTYKRGSATPQAFEFPVHTLGKENGASKLQSILAFERLILTEQYDRVFVHMAPVWYTLGCWWWTLKGTPTYLWYTHYKMQLGVRLFGWFGTRFFCATPQSLPQYDSSPKKTVTGHGIDLTFWSQRPNTATDPTRLLVVHRLSRSKRLELSIRALILLDGYTMDIYGIEAEKDYAAEMKALVEASGLAERVTFHGTVPMARLPEIYASHRLLLNMASETIDKTMIEVLTCGCYPVTTAANTKAIGLPSSPSAETPEAIAEFVRMHGDKQPLTSDQMYAIAKKHSLEGLVKKMGKFMREGK